MLARVEIRVIRIRGMKMLVLDTVSVLFTAIIAIPVGYIIAKIDWHHLKKYFG